MDSSSLTAEVANNQNNEDLPASFAISTTIISAGNTYKVTSIADEAFYKVSSIQSVAINENLIRIGSSAFNQAQVSFGNLQLLSTLQEIGRYAFAINDIYQIKIPSKPLKLILVVISSVMITSTLYTIRKDKIDSSS